MNTIFLKLHRINSAVAYNFRRWALNPRIIFTFCFAFILCFLLSSKVTAFSKGHDTNMQIAEAFVWTFEESSAIMLASMLLILMLGDMPFLGPNTPYFLHRTTRKEWLTGQVLYIITVTLIYCVFVLGTTSILCMQRSFVGNMWSETAAMLGFTSAGSEIAVPAFVRTMEMTTPYECMGVIFLLMTLYAMVLVMIMLYFNIRYGRTAGVVSAFAFSLYGYLLTPSFIQTLFSIPDDRMYLANVILGWLSPLNHATYHMHSFGYDRLPTLWQTFLILIGICALLYLLTLRAMKKYNFCFNGGANKIS